MIQLLMSVTGVDPSANDNEAMKAAAENGHFEMVKFLSTMPSVEAVVALPFAALAGNAEMVEFVLSFSGIDLNAALTSAAGRAYRYR